MNNFFRRTLTGASFVTIVILSLLTHPFAFAALTVLLNIIALLEYRKMDRILLTRPATWIFINSLLLALMQVINVLELPLSVNILGIILLVSYLYIYSLYSRKENNWDFLVRSVFSSLYISLPLLILNLLHTQYDAPGFPLVLILFILIWVNDSFAYIFGLWLGKHRLFERISPKKSWEGFIGGFLTTLLVVWILSLYFPTLTLTEWIILGFLTVLAAVYGDFVESLLKRSAGVKDSGSLLPGHGGVLDRIDSLLLVGPIIYGYLLLINLF